MVTPISTNSLRTCRFAPPKAKGRTPGRERVIAGFEEINYHETRTCPTAWGRPRHIRAPMLRLDRLCLSQLPRLA